MRAIVALICVWIIIAFSSTSASTLNINAAVGLDTNHVITATQMTMFMMARKGKA